MPLPWSRALILGGIRSGKSELAEELVTRLAGTGPVRYVATARSADGTDAQWAARIEAHQGRRPDGWATTEAVLDLADVLASADPAESLLVDDLGNWLAAVLEADPNPVPEMDRLTDAISACPANLVLVSPEVGLSVVPATPLGRAFADALGAVNRAVAERCDVVGLVVAGQPLWVKGRPAPFGDGTLTDVQPAVPPSARTSSGAHADIRPGLSLTAPDFTSAAAARDRLTTLNLGVAAPAAMALGELMDAVEFVAGVQATAYPRPFLSTRVILLAGTHEGGVSAGPAVDPRTGAPLAHAAATAKARVVTLEWTPAAERIEVTDAVSADQRDAALRIGWTEADRAVDEGIEALVLAAGGPGSATAAVAVIAAVTGAEPAALLPRIITSTGHYDDEAWMIQCAAVRDALHRVRDRSGDPLTVLMALGGADIAAATGLILGAASRKTPVLIDGPVGAAAALLARDFAPQAKSWVLIPDHGGHPAVSLAADAMSLTPFLNLKLSLGEGAAALTALPLLQTALTLAGMDESAALGLAVAGQAVMGQSTAGRAPVGRVVPPRPTLPDDIEPWPAFAAATPAADSEAAEAASEPEPAEAAAPTADLWSEAEPAPEPSRERELSPEHSPEPEIEPSPGHSLKHELELEPSRERELSPEHSPESGHAPNPASEPVDVSEREWEPETKAEPETAVSESAVSSAQDAGPAVSDPEASASDEVGAESGPAQKEPAEKEPAQKEQQAEAADARG